MWSGLPQLVLFPAMPFLMKQFDPRILVVIGTLLFASSCFINVNLTHDVGMDQLILPQLLRAAGQPLFAIPLSQLSTANLAPARYGRRLGLVEHDAQPRRIGRHRSAFDGDRPARTLSLLDPRRSDDAKRLREHRSGLPC